jgi:predicted HAD superfamily phosphohydrolase
MSEFADVFAYDLTSTVYVAGSIIALIVFAAAAIWTNREPAQVSEFSPSYGL